MADRTMHIGPALLAIPFICAALVICAALASAVRAEPAAESGAPADCLTKPSGPSPRGSHWHYHLDRPSGRHCWYLREENAKAGQTDTTMPRSSAAPVAQPGVVAPADGPAADTAPNTRADTLDESRTIAPPVAAPSSSAASPPAAWPSAAPPPSTEREPALEGNSAATQMPSTADSNADMRVDARKGDLEARPPKRLAARSPDIERPPLSVEEPAHMPVLLGTALALAIIIVGYLGARLAYKLFWRPRRRPVLDLPKSSWSAPLSRTDAAPGIIPAMPHRADQMRGTPRVSPYAPRRGWNDDPQGESDHRNEGRDRGYAPGGQADRRYVPPRPQMPQMPADHREQAREQNGTQAAPQSRDAARVLEDNVRELLHRLRAELQANPKGSAGRDATAFADGPRRAKPSA